MPTSVKQKDSGPAASATGTSAGGQPFFNRLLKDDFNGFAVTPLAPGFQRTTFNGTSLDFIPGKNSIALIHLRGGGKPPGIVLDWVEDKSAVNEFEMLAQLHKATGAAVVTARYIGTWDNWNGGSFSHSSILRTAINVREFAYASGAKKTVTVGDCLGGAFALHLASTSNGFDNLVLLSPLVPPGLMGLAKEKPPEAAEWYIDVYKYNGLTRSALASFRSGAMFPFSPEALARKNLLVFYGSRDPIVLPQLEFFFAEVASNDRGRGIPGTLELVKLEAGHDLGSEAAKAFSKALGWIQKRFNASTG